MTTQRRKPRIDGDVLKAFETLVVENPEWGPSQVHSKLKELFRDSGKAVPTIRTIQERFRDLADPSGPWSSSSAAPDDAALVLPVLAVVIDRTQGKRRFLTNNEARWLVHVRTLAPDLSDDLYYSFILARAYAALDALKEPLMQLDAFVSYAPWRGPEEAKRYQNAVTQGWVPSVFPFFWTLTMAENVRRFMRREE